MADTNVRPADDSIGTWSVGQLSKFIQDVLVASPPPIPSGSVVAELGISSRLVMSGDLQFDLSAATVSTPGTVSKYFRVTDVGGKPFYIPAYLP